MSTRKLRTWQDAGLINADTAAAIEAWEDENAKPLGLWAAIGIGALAIGLGVISIVAANWEDVPAQVRLGIHLALLAGLAGFVFWRGERLEAENPWALEATLFVFAMLGMTFFGHIGQVYQTTSPLWQPLTAWLAMFGPILLLRGQSWLTAALVMVATIYTAWAYVDAIDPGWTHREHFPVALASLVTAAPIMLAPLAAFLRDRSARAVFWKRLQQLALTYALGGASLTAIVAAATDFDDGLLSATAQAIWAGIGLLAGGLMVLARQTRAGQASGIITAGAGLTCFLASVVSGSSFGAGLVFMALWLGIAMAALRAGWRHVFQLAVAVIAIRLIVLSFELASDLLTSGFSLIFAGVMILAVAWVAVQVSREYAPPKEGDA